MAAHRLEEIRHRLRVKARGGEKTDADSIRLVFLRAGEVDLLLDGGALGGGDRALHGAAVAAGGRPDEDGGENRGGGHEALLALRVDLARDMALRDVRRFVREHACKLRLIAAGENRPVVKPDEAAGQREGVDARFAHREVLEVPGGGVGGLRGQAHAERLHVLVDFRIIDDAVLVAQLPHDHLADLPLLVHRNHGRGRVTDLRQLGLRLRTDDAGRDRQACGEGQEEQLCQGSHEILAGAKP